MLIHRGRQPWICFYCERP